MRGTYLYAILAGEPQFHLQAVGLPGGTADLMLVTAGDLSALISDYEGAAFTDLPKPDLLNALIIHQRVIEEAMTAGSLLPVKFGTVLQSPDQVRAALARHDARLHDALSEIGDAVEIDLSATWDVNVMLAGIAQEPQVVALAGMTAVESVEDAVGTRIQVGKLVQETLARRRESLRRQVLGGLLSLARDAAPHPLPSDDLVLNVAFLVERRDLEQFEAAVDRIGEDLADTLTFRYVGPLPPYSFATVELAVPDVEKIDSARHELGLGENVSETEVRESYRRLAAEMHPDRNPGDAAAQERFVRLTAAHALLTGYMRGQRTQETQRDAEPRYDLTPGAVASTVLLDITRVDLAAGNPSEA